MATIGGNLYTRNVNNLNRVQKDSKDLLSVIIILGKYFNGGETVFYDGWNMSDIEKRAHVLKHSHERCVIGSFDKILHNGSIWNGHGAVLYFILHKSIFPHFVHNGTIFYVKYISSKHGKIILMMTEVYFSPNNRLERNKIQNINFKISIYLFKSLSCYEK